MRRTWGSTGLVAALAIGAAACGGGDDGDGSGDGPAGLDGTIVVSGSSTVEPISALVAEIFNETNPDVSITVDGPGTGDGFELFCNGETDISDASRPIEQEEAAACEANGIRYTELEVAFDGITVMTNPENTAVECLNKGDLYALFGPESEGFSTWSDANGLATEVGGNGGFPDQPLDITAPGEESGTYDAFVELSGIPDTAVERGIPDDESEALRTDYQSSPNDNVIIQAMAGSPSSLGFVGFAFAEDAGDQVREIAIDDGGGCVAPSAASIADGSYPLSRSLYIYVNEERVSENPALQAYVDYYLTDEALNDIVSQVGYIPLPSDRVDATRGVWADAA
jgi:phosphate transport system substrate-binding protein